MRRCRCGALNLETTITEIMTNFSSLPIELRIKIVETLYKTQDGVLDGTWTCRGRYRRPSEIDLRSKRFLSTPMGAQCSITNDLVLSTGSCAALNTLGLVSRGFYDICRFVAFHELEIDHSQKKDDPSLTKAFEKTVELVPNYVKVIKVHLGRRSKPPHTRELQWKALVKDIATVIGLCKHTETISLYYSDGEADITDIGNQILTMIEDGTVRNIGIYSADILQDNRSTWDISCIDQPKSLLHSILMSLKACEQLRRLDIVMEHIDIELMQLLQRRPTSLHTLTIRRAMRLFHIRPFLPFHMNDWALNSNLTRLTLVYCQMAYADLMIPLIGHFYFLEEFTWAHCGHWWRSSKSPPPSGWSKEANTLPNVRPPLKLLHIEDASSWELEIMGQIPAERVIISDRDEEKIAKVFTRTDEIFPSTNALHILPGAPDYIAHFGSLLEVVCRRRMIRLLRDARVLFP